MVHDRLDALVEHLLYLEKPNGDRATDDAAYLLIPRDQREVLSELAEKLDEVRDGLSRFSSPRQEFLKDTSRLEYISPPGWPDFRKAAGEQLADVISSSFLEELGVHPVQWPKGREGSQSINRENREESIATVADEVVYEVLARLAATLRQAEQAIMVSTPSGGRRPNPIRDRLLINLVAIWRDAFDGQKRVYFNETSRQLFDFCSAFCVLLGVRSFCTDAHLKAACKTFREKQGQ